MSHACRIFVCGCEFTSALSFVRAELIYANPATQPRSIPTHVRGKVKELQCET